MPAPILSQVGSLALYALSTADQAAPPGIWAGYRPGPRASFGASASLSAAWQDAGGVFLFLSAAPTDPAAFLAGFDALLPGLSPTGELRFAWIGNPNDPPAAWRVDRVDALPSGSAGSIAWTTSRRASLALGGYAVQIAAGTALLLAATGDGYDVSAARRGVSFRAPGGLYPAQGSDAALPMQGTAVGAWRFDVSLPNGGSSQETSPDDLARLGVELRYAVPAEVRGTADAVPMPILRQAGAPLSMQLTFDPLHPLVADRTNLSFFGSGGAGNPPALDAAFVTPRGYGTTLTPVSAAAPLVPARLAFCTSPRVVTDEADASVPDVYLAPDGAFALAVKGDAPLTPGAVAERISLGLSGLEYVGLPGRTGCTVLFRAGCPAYAPSARTTPDDLRGGDGGDLLTPLATTSYAAFLTSAPAANGLTYFAQPAQAPLFTAGGSMPAGFLGFHEMPATALGGWAAGGPAPSVMPVGAYAAIDPALADVAQRLEQSAIAPARRAAIGAPSSGGLSSEGGGSGAGGASGQGGAGQGGGAHPSVDPVLAVTPQGLVATLSADGTAWAGLVLGNLPRSQTPQVALTEVRGDFQAALQSSELFFVVADVDVFMSSSSVAYRLDPAGLALLPARGVPQATVQALDSLLAAMSPAYPTFPTETAFVAAVGATAGEHLPQVLDAAGLLDVDLDGWKFQLSPRSWRTAADSPTVMVFKFCGRSLSQLVADPSAWGWPAAAGDVARTQAALERAIANAVNAGPDSPYADFLDDVVLNPSWNGVLFFNAPVEASELPAELQFVAAGIDPAGFFAHHVGFSLTPFDASGAAITLGQTAVFGLVDYSDPVDLYAETTVPFAFKTLSLTARFANAALAEFSARVELLVNRLFGVELTKVNPTHGNNLVLAGSCQRQNGAASYAFVLQGQNVYATMRSMVESVEILGVQLQTGTGSADGGTVTASFTLRGNLRFRDLPLFDPFSYGTGYGPNGATPPDGWLRFGNLVVGMSFSLADPDAQAFTVAEDRLSFDLGASQPRPAALAANFPVRLTGIAYAPADAGAPGGGQTPEDRGFTSISAPMEQQPLHAPWYGLVYSLDLGTLGALAGGAPLAVTVLAAWGPGLIEGDQPAYLGLALPGAKALGIDWPLQGVMRLGFRSFQFEAGDEDDGSRSYILRLRRLALSILGWSFPPGNTDVFLLGQPDSSGRPVVGWYAAYSKTAPKKSPTPAPAPRARAALPAGAPDPASASTELAVETSTRAARQTMDAAVARRQRAGRRTQPPTGGA